MKIDSFKKSLVQYLTESWKNHDLATYLGNKALYVNCENKVYAYKVEDSKLIVTEENRLYSDHEEADSRRIFHVKEIAASDELKDIVIRAIDTDVLIIAPGCYEELEEKNLWMEVGLYSNNTIRYIDIKRLYNTFGPKLSKSLPAYHAITGCDYTAAFSRKGKVNPFKILQKREDIQQSLGNITSIQECNDVENKILEFICLRYDAKKQMSINEVKIPF